jgi:hypothetical protein
MNRKTKFNIDELQTQALQYKSAGKTQLEMSQIFGFRSIEAMRKYFKRHGLLDIIRVNQCSR